MYYFNKDIYLYPEITPIENGVTMAGTSSISLDFYIQKNKAAFSSLQ